MVEKVNMKSGWRLSANVIECECCSLASEINKQWNMLTEQLYYKVPFSSYLPIAVFSLRSWWLELMYICWPIIWVTSYFSHPNFLVSASFMHKHTWDMKSGWVHRLSPWFSKGPGSFMHVCTDRTELKCTSGCSKSRYFQHCQRWALWGGQRPVMQPNKR